YSRGLCNVRLRLLRGLQHDMDAFIAVRYLTVSMLQNPGEDSARHHCYMVGRRVQDEQVLRQFKQAEPDRFWMLQRELDSRHSKDPRHHMTLALKDMRSLNLEPINWGLGNREQVGAYLIEHLRGLGMLELWHSRKQKHGKTSTHTHLRLSFEVLELL